MKYLQIAAWATALASLVALVCLRCRGSARSVTPFRIIQLACPPIRTVTPLRLISPALPFEAASRGVRRRQVRTWVIRALALNAALAVAFLVASKIGAFESFVLNISAHVERPPTIISTTVTANPLAVITQQQVDTAYFAATGEKPDPNFHCLQAGTKHPILVPIQTCVFWVMRITVTNNFSTPISNVTVTDDFGGQPPRSVPVSVEILNDARDSSARQSFPTQYRILWCVTGNLDRATEQCTKAGDSRDLLAPAATETLDMLVFTKLDPVGRQEYTSPCTGSVLCYELNARATATWIDTRTGSQMSQSTEPMMVGTLPPASGQTAPGQPPATGALKATSTPDSCTPVLLDFASVQVGAQPAEQYARDGIHISGIRNSEADQVIVFDSAAPNTPYPDLQVDRGHLAILRGESGQGGTQKYVFDQDRLVTSFVFVAAGSNPVGFAEFFDARKVSLGRVNISLTGESSGQTIEVHIGGVRRMEITYVLASGVTDIRLDCGNANTTPTPTRTGLTPGLQSELENFLDSQPANVLLEPGLHTPTSTATPTPTRTATATPTGDVLPR